MVNVKSYYHSFVQKLLIYLVGVSVVNIYHLLAFVLYVSR